MSTKRFALILLLLSVLLLGASCESSINEPSETSVDQIATSLRSNDGERIHQALLVSLWGNELKDSLLITEAQLHASNKYQLNKTMKMPEDGGYLSVVSPSSLIRSKQYALLFQKDQEEVYYYGTKIDTTPVDVSLKRVQAKFTFKLDLSSFAKDVILEHIDLHALYDYAWINLMDGTFETVEGNYARSVPLSVQIGKEIGSITDDKGVYSHSMLIIPAQQQELMLHLFIDGREYVVSVVPESIEAGKDYVCHVQILNKYSPVTLTKEEKSAGAGTIEITYPSFPDFEYTLVSNCHRDLSNKHGAIFEFWVDSRVDRERELEYKLLIKDKTGKVVSQSPTYGGLVVKPYFYDGFQLPIYIDVPYAGNYEYQLLLRSKGNEAFYEPDQRADDLPKDKTLKIHNEQSVFVSYFLITGESSPASSITKQELHREYRAHLSLINYSASEQNVTIRLYHYRNPLKDHSNLHSVIDENPIATWKDLIGTKRLLLPAHTATPIEIPYKFTMYRPIVNRFPASITATIEYNNNGAELPLLRDGTFLYKYSHSSYNPNPIINGSGVYNQAYIELQG